MADCENDDLKPEDMTPAQRASMSEMYDRLQAQMDALIAERAAEKEEAKQKAATQAAKRVQATPAPKKPDGPTMLDRLQRKVKEHEDALAKLRQNGRIPSSLENHMRMHLARIKQYSTAIKIIDFENEYGTMPSDWRLAKELVEMKTIRDREKTKGDRLEKMINANYVIDR
jgi:hypothetical protein